RKPPLPANQRQQSYSSDTLLSTTYSFYLLLGLYSQVPPTNDIYGNGYKHSNSAPTLLRQNQYTTSYNDPVNYPIAEKKQEGWGFKRLFSFMHKSDKQRLPPVNNHTEYENEEYGYGDDPYYSNNYSRNVKPQQPVTMRTGRTQENTSLNVRARQRSTENPREVMNRRLKSPVAPAPPIRYRNSGNNSYAQTTRQRPTAVIRGDPYNSGSTSYRQQRQQPQQSPYSSVSRISKQCYECGAMNAEYAKFCNECGTRRI
ncbi:unnamed protein product, partial [Didymodactylos carnosus]